MTFEEYGKRALAFRFYPDHDFGYAVLGLCGETGEVAEKLKKIRRDKGGVMTEEDKFALLKELSDVLWYVTAAADELGSTIGEVAHIGIRKLEARKERGTLGGSGDDR